MIVCHCRGLSDFALRAAGTMPRGSHCSEACRSECQRIVGPWICSCGEGFATLQELEEHAGTSGGLLHGDSEPVPKAQGARRCARCYGPEAAHFEPDAAFPRGVCMCAAPDGRTPKVR